MTSQDDPLLNAYLASPDPDTTLREQLAAIIESRRADRTMTPPQQSNESLHLFLAGYAGAGNAGADIRVTEMIRQFRHVFGRNIRVVLSVIDPRLTGALPRDVELRDLTFLPRFLPAQIAQCEVAVACEGSMFKSNFSDAISLVMLGTLGLGVAEGKLAVGYGAEAGPLTPKMEVFAREYCRGALITCRSESSHRRITNLGLRTAPGTDTAWTYEPADPCVAHRLLVESGWDGSAEIITVCPVNPFWWPVRPDPVRYAAWLREGLHDDYHYGFFYFHNDSPENALRTRGYLESLAGAVTAYCRERGAFPIIVGMDKVDRMVCRQLTGILPFRCPVFANPDFTAAQLVALLRKSTVLVSSRFHAIVCAMPAAIPIIGISYDERIENLLAEGGSPELILRADDCDLTERLLQTLGNLDSEKAADCAERITSENLRRLGDMTRDFADEVLRFGLSHEHPALGHGWEAHLPRLSKPLLDVLERHPPDINSC